MKNRRRRSRRQVDAIILLMLWVPLFIFDPSVSVKNDKTNKHKWCKGKIFENGDIRPLDVKEGDQILFGKYSGTEITIDGEEMLVMREDDITAIITN